MMMSGCAMCNLLEKIFVRLDERQTRLSRTARCDVTPVEIQVCSGVSRVRLERSEITKHFFSQVICVRNCLWLCCI